jgi:hypothetical protein
VRGRAEKNWEGGGRGLLTLVGAARANDHGESTRAPVLCQGATMLVV